MSKFMKVFVSVSLILVTMICSSTMCYAQSKGYLDITINGVDLRLELERAFTSSDEINACYSGSKNGIDYSVDISFHNSFNVHTVYTNTNCSSDFENLFEAFISLHSNNQGKSKSGMYVASKYSNYCRSNARTVLRTSNASFSQSMGTFSFELTAADSNKGQYSGVFSVRAELFSKQDEEVYFGNHITVSDAKFNFTISK